MNQKNRSTIAGCLRPGAHVYLQSKIFVCRERERKFERKTFWPIEQSTTLAGRMCEQFGTLSAECGAHVWCATNSFTHMCAKHVVLLTETRKNNKMSERWRERNIYFIIEGGRRRSSSHFHCVSVKVGVHLVDGYANLKSSVGKKQFICHRQMR